MTDLSAFELGEKSGRTFRESVEDQLSAIAAKLGIRTASLETGPYGGSSTGGSARGMGTAGRGRRTGRPGSGSLGGGETYHARPEPAYRGEPVLGEEPIPQNDAERALHEGFKQAQNTESRIKHGAGTEAECRT